MSLLKEKIKDVNKLSEEEYALVRKETFGASDTGVLMGVGYSTLESLIATKAIPYVTDEEKEISNKPSVRKGKDLEELIIRPKIAQALGMNLSKPTTMYELEDAPFFTINYDAMDETGTIPVELKYVTTFGTKNFDTKKNFYNNVLPDTSKMSFPNPAERIKYMASVCGVPPYYYTQAQLQIHGLQAPYGYIGALFEKDWEVRIYKIPYDRICVTDIYIKGFKANEDLKKARGE